jgi:hypothetical protein
LHSGSFRPKSVQDERYGCEVFVVEATFPARKPQRPCAADPHGSFHEGSAAFLCQLVFAVMLRSLPIPAIFDKLSLAGAVFALGFSLLSSEASAQLTFNVPNQSPGTGVWTGQVIDAPASAILANPKSLVADELSINLAFEPPEPGPQMDRLQYEVTVSNPGWWFSEVALYSAVPSAGGVVVTKEIYSDPSYTTLVWSATSIDGSNLAFQPIPHYYSTLYVIDLYTIPAGKTLGKVGNSYRQSPAPLPLIGAGAAFGFSRKLRKRIKAARLS